MNDILWRRLRYMLSPQWDIYRHIAPKVVGQDVLEVGFGTGFGTVQLAGTAKEVMAYEIDLHAFSFASQCFPLGNVTWHFHDISHHSRHKDEFDSAVMVETLEHIRHWEQTLSKVRDSIKPGGKLYITARNANADLRRNELHEREWTAKEFKAALLQYFNNVTLYDYTLNHEQGDDTRMTPLVAVADKGA